MSPRAPNPKSTHAGRASGSRQRGSRTGASAARLTPAGVRGGGAAIPPAHGASSTVDPFRRSVVVFAALGDKTRLHLVSRLCAGGPLSITRLSDGVDVTRQAITKHLNILAGAGLVRDIRAGRERLWEIETRQLEEARRCLDRISSQWDEALSRLRDLATSEGIPSGDRAVEGEEL